MTVNGSPMTGAELLEANPLGSIVRYSDGTPQPPARHAKKLRAWQNGNGEGRLIHIKRKTTSNDWDIDTLTLEVFTSKVIVARMTFPANGSQRFEIIAPPPAGSIIAYSEFQGTPEINHFWDSKTAARAWADSERYDLRRYGRKHWLVQENGSFADWDASEVYDACAVG